MLKRNVPSVDTFGVINTQKSELRPLHKFEQDHCGHCVASTKVVDTHIDKLLLLLMQAMTLSENDLKHDLDFTFQKWTSTGSLYS